MLEVNYLLNRLGEINIGGNSLLSHNEKKDSELAKSFCMFISYKHKWAQDNIRVL